MKRLSSAVVLLAMTAVSGCQGPSSSRPSALGSSAPASSTIRFVDQAEAVGLRFVHRNGMTGKFLEAEIYAPGVALLDYDNDGDLDVYVVQGALPGVPADATVSDRLFRNDLAISAAGARTLRFTDVTSPSRVDERSYGLAVAAADYDGDGWIDIFSTRLDRYVLLHNNHDGTFTDVTVKAGLGGRRTWGSAATFVDIDRDGRLDLFVGHYFQYDIKSDINCFTPAGAPDYCDPSEYRAALPRLYRNEGNGVFADHTSALRGTMHGAALGVLTSDLNGDGWPDIYVANDRQENDLWLNMRDGTFSNGALAAGVALNADGHAEGSMGVDAGDVDNDGDEDLIVANFTSEGHTFYVNRGDGTFDDGGTRSGLRPASLPFTGFGAAWLDADNDGALDLLVVNGAVQVLERLVREGVPFPLSQQKQMFRGRGDGRFEDVSNGAGPAVTTAHVSRGAAFGDIDNDGDIDVVVGNNNGPLQLLMNETTGQGHWVGFRLVARAGSTNTVLDQLGARVELTQGSRRLLRRARSDGSYASANDPRVLVGLGREQTQPSVVVTWPDGQKETFASVPVDQWSTLTRGTGR